MAYLTDRKRAAGLGSAKSGTAHHWHMTVTSVALAILVPLFIFTFGAALGGSYEEISAYYAHPFPSIVAALTITVGFVHFANGARMMLEDYVHGGTLRALIIAVNCISYAAVATGLFALVKLAL
ncbi:MAG: succinate dehydrogenase, hydrophobic membrane anchor protein [Pseudoruegeria sp.]